MGDHQDDFGDQGSTTSVLVVEDEPSARAATALYLKSRGYDVATAGDGETALRIAAEMSPDVVVSDWRLGDGPDGVDVARRIGRQCGSAIIFATAYPLDELKEAARGLPVRHYFRKPVSLPALAKAIAPRG